MVTELITFKIDDRFLKEVDSIVKENNYQNRTEFIRAALREKVDKAKYDEIYRKLLPLKGTSKKKTADEDLHKIRQQVFDEIYAEKNSSGR